MSEQDDHRFRSRKFRLAVWSLVVATITMGFAQWALYRLAMATLLDATNYRMAAVAVLYWWLFCDLGVLGGYGVPNVIEKWSPKGGGA